MTGSKRTYRIAVRAAVAAVLALLFFTPGVGVRLGERGAINILIAALVVAGIGFLFGLLLDGLSSDEP